MAYKALYRIYRPQKFSEVVGQDVIVKTLQNELKIERVSHAYLFCGPRGTGKTTIARVFAKALNCKDSDDFEPCNRCSSCVEITDGVSPDVIEIDAASNNGVDEIRELKEKVKFLPAGAKYKIYIIDEVHMLSASAFNALLKTLEEPPKHAIFILATTEPHKVPNTIVSRCQRYDFKSLTINDLVSSLKSICTNEEVEFTKEALNIIAMASDGGLRDAISFLDQAISLCDTKITEEIAANVTGNICKDKLVELANYLEDKKITETLQTIQELQNSGREVGKIINNLLTFYRDILLCKNVATNFSKTYVEFSKKIDFRKIYFNIDVLSDVQNKIRYGNTPEIYFEVAIIRMINASSEDLDFGKRIADLENKITNMNFEGGSSFSSEDLKRLRILEEKFNNLLGELSKLEIPKLIDRVKALETNSFKGVVGADPSLKEMGGRVDKIIEDLELLKVIQNTLRSEVENFKTGDIDEELLTSKIDEVVKKVKPNVNYSEVEAFVKRQLDYFEEKVNDKIDNIEPVTKIVEHVETRIVPEAVKKEDKESIVTVPVDEIKALQERISKVESNVYKIMAGLLSNTSPAKKTKSKGDDRQISLWKDEIVDLEKADTTVVPKADFMDLNKEDNNVINESDYEEKDLEDSEQKNNENVSEVNKQPKSNIPSEIDNTYEELFDEEENQITEENLFSETEFDRPDDEDNIKFESKEIVNIETKENKNNFFGQEVNANDINEENFEENLFDENMQTEAIESNNNAYDEELKLAKEQELKHEQELLAQQEREKRLEETKLKEAEKVRQELEFKRQQEQEDQRRLQEEREQIIAEKKREQLEIELKKELEDQSSYSKEGYDEYSLYDVKVLERIMNDSFTPEFREEKGRLVNLWKHIVSLAPVEKRGVAEMLAEGEIMALGNHEFVLVYANASMCNQVMGRRFKRSSLKLLFDLLNTDYNYFAITREIWVLKRQEYADQHSIGIMSPTLSPIIDPLLKVNNEDNEEDDMTRNIIDVFGDSVKIKKKE